MCYQSSICLLWRKVCLGLLRCRHREQTCGHSWGRRREGRIERVTLKHIHHHMQNKQPVEICYMMQGAQTWCSVTTQRSRMQWEVEGGHMYVWRTYGCKGTYVCKCSYVCLWLIHVDTWQKLTQYCKAIILQLKVNKIKAKKKKNPTLNFHLRILEKDTQISHIQILLNVCSMWLSIGAEGYEKGIYLISSIEILHLEKKLISY